MKRPVILFLLCALLTGVDAAFGGSTTTTKIKHHFVENSFLYIKNGKSFCYDGVGLSEIDTRQMRLHPVRDMPQGFKRMGLSQDNKLWGLQKHGKHLELLSESELGWKSIELPSDLAFKNPDYSQIMVKGGRIVIFQGANLHIWDGNRWICKKCPAVNDDTGKIDWVPNEGSLYPFKILIGDGCLYLGYSAGEFGGSLVELKLKDGNTKLTNLDYPVSDMKLDRLGKLWFTTALGHMGLLNSEIFVLAAGRPKLISAVECEIAPRQENVPQNRYAYNRIGSKNWNFGATEIYQIIETAKGQLVFVTQDEGLFYLDKGRIKRIGKFFQRPREVFDCTVNADGNVYILDADGIEIVKTNFKL